MIQKKKATANHLETGKKGESLAVAYLQQNGFTILRCNWRHSFYEIDIIASKNGVLHFIEIKTRRTMKYGFPEESVSVKKIRSLLKGAAIYLLQHPGWKRVQLDVLSITMLPEREPEYFLIEDVSL